MNLDNHRKKLARLWHSRAQLTRADIFADEDVALRPIGAHSQADIAVPGMVGEAYKRGGLAIVSINPAGGKDEFQPSRGDAKLYNSAQKICSSDSVDLFDELSRAYQAGMPSWGAQWRHIIRILRAANRDLSQLAYPYVVPFRSRDDQGSQLSYNIVKRGYDTGFAAILTELAPALIIAVDRHSERAVHQFKADSRLDLDIIYYTRQLSAHAARDLTLMNIADHPFSRESVAPPASELSTAPIDTSH